MKTTNETKKLQKEVSKTVNNADRASKTKELLRRNSFHKNLFK